jgi:hypothetical protein
MPAVTRGEPFFVARGSNPAGEADTKSSDISAFSNAVTAKLRVSRTSHRHSVGWVVGWKFAFPCNQGDQPFCRLNRGWQTLNGWVLIIYGPFFRIRPNRIRLS